MDLKKIKEHSNNFYTYQSDEFGSIKIHFKFLVGDSKEDYVKNYILGAYLNRTNKKYKTLKEINDKKKELYGLGCSTYSSTLGNKNILCFDINLASATALEIDYFDEAIEFCKDLIFQPNFQDNKLDKDVLNEIKRDMINYQINDLKTPSVMQSRLLLKELVPDSIIVNRLCYDINELKEFLDKLTDQDIINFYNKTISSCIGGFAFGNLSNKEIDKIINTFKFNHIKLDNNYSTKLNLTDGEIEIVSKDTTQSYLYIAYDIKDYEIVDGYIKNSYIYNALEGMLNIATGPLMETLRTKLGIVYHCYADIFSRYGFMIICAQIDKKNKVKAIEGIESALNELRNRETCTKLLQYVKEKMNQNYITCQDKINYQIDEVGNKTFKTTKEFKDKVDKVNKLTVEDIEKQLDNLEKKFIYFYKGDKDEK